MVVMKITVSISDFRKSMNTWCLKEQKEAIQNVVGLAVRNDIIVFIVVKFIFSQTEKEESERERDR